MAVINEQLMRRNAAALGKIAQAKVRAFDVFYYYERRKENRMQLASYSFGEQKYVRRDGILQGFLKTKGSLARLSGSFRAHGSIRCDRQSKFSRLRFKPYNTSGKLREFRSSRIEAFEDHLARHSFGRDYLLCGIILGFGGVKVHISSFVLFAARLDPVRQKELQSELVWQLQSDFMNRIIEDFARNEKKLGMVEALVRQIRHLWLKFGFKGNLSSIEEALRTKNRRKAMEAYRRMASAYLFYEMAGEILYSLSWEPGASLMKTRNLVTYTRLIKLLRKTQWSERTKVDLKGLSAAEQSKFNTIGSLGLVYAFVLFENLWSNAIKSARHVVVTFKSSRSGMEIEITNDGEMDARVVRYLNGKRVHKSWGGEGAAHIRTAVKHIEGASLRVVSESGFTTVIFCIQ